MVDLPWPQAKGKPVDAVAYFDKVQVWLKFAVNNEELAWLNRNCGKGGAHIDVSLPARWDASYRARLSLHQPNWAVLEWIDRRADALINQVEVALDLIWPSDRQADAAFWFFHKHLIRLHHGKTQQLRFYGDSATGEIGTLYDGQRWHTNLLTIYRWPNDRFTGEVLPILHIEWRANGVDALKQLGLPSHLLDFDFRAFWSKRLLLVDVEAERLGRFLRNQGSGKRARQPNLKEVRSREDLLNRRLGHIVLNKYERHQELLDSYRHAWRRQRVSRVFNRLDNSSFLPGEVIEAVEVVEDVFEEASIAVVGGRKLKGYPQDRASGREGLVTTETSLVGGQAWRQAWLKQQLAMRLEARLRC